MIDHPASKYQPFPAIQLTDRQWPGRTIAKAPIWMSSDLRDGNQSLFEPMDAERKMRMFSMLCEVGFKEIEVAFPSASQTEFDFVRKLITEKHIPDDVTIEVLTQSREHLIRRTFESLRGARRAIVHIYNATAPVFRELVFGMDKQEVVQLALDAVRLVRQLASEQPETEWVLQYSPEVFSSTELDFALEICNAVSAEWGATPERKLILNLPATVEVATPNVYADQIEWMHKNLQRRDSIVLSLHPHNDRGTAVAAAELGLMAGADRVEGCLFGSGERTGNVDLVTLALNLYTQGVAPGLDFSDINAVARTVEHCNQMQIHPRHPYVGDLVFTAFSGSHQDAIRKGLAAQQPEASWQVPYLPIDPSDLGRSYGSVIRVNSQSGKGGVAYLMETEFGIRMPRRLQVEFAGVVQAKTEATGGEIGAAQLRQLFVEHYLQANGAGIGYLDHQMLDRNTTTGVASATQGIVFGLQVNGHRRELVGYGNGPIDAAVNALQTLGLGLKVRSFEEHSVRPSTKGGNAQACAFMELAASGGAGEKFGVGMHDNIVTASLLALVSAVNRLGVPLQILASEDGAADNNCQAHSNEEISGV